MAQALRLLVGLGNPGSKYAETRHNAGFWFAEELARRLNVRLTSNAKFFARTAQCRAQGLPFLLCTPNTFMNRSGQTVGAIARFYKLEPEQIVVVHDDIDLPPGTVKLKQGGGHGGNNGVRDIIAHLGNREFGRIRLGIGHPGDRNEVIDYVLKRPSAQDTCDIKDAIEQTLNEIESIVVGDWAKAMNVLHTRNT